MKYMLLFCRTEGDRPAWDDMAPEAQAELGAAIGRWQSENDSRFIDRGFRLAPSSSATTVRRKDDRVLVTDGPFVEGNEVVAGYVVVDVPDLDEAMRMARTFPACPTTEIRPLAEQ
jgi:hypothetical protein